MTDTYAINAHRSARAVDVLTGTTRGGEAGVEREAGASMPSLPRSTSRALAATLFLITGTLHFVFSGLFARIVPPQLPHPLLLVHVSGAFELLGAIGLLISGVRAAAVYGLIALLVAVFPANIYMAVDARDFHTLAPPELLWLRLPLQVVLIAWVYSLKPERRAPSANPGQERTCGDKIHRSDDPAVR